MSENELIIQIPVTALRSNPKNPRAGVGDVAELASSMKQMGVLEPLIVVADVGELTGDPTGTYTIVAGHRRHAAAKLAGLETVPCVVRSMVGIQQLRAMMTENIVRENMTVYDEAQGFQMMIDLGDTPAEIAERTGFSTTTVRRRLKMAELDKDKLRAVAADEERQLTLGDFDRLAQIEDLVERNKVLDKIGTRDFDQAMSWALKKQAVDRNMPTVKAWLKEHGAKEIKANDTWSGKYERYSQQGSNIWIEKLGEPGNQFPEARSEQMFYHITSNSVLELYRKSRKPEKQKKTPEQLAREKAVAEAWETLDAMARQFWELRRDFVDNVRTPNQNQMGAIWEGLYYAVVLNDLTYSYTGAAGRNLKEILKIEGEAYKDGFADIVAKQIIKTENWQFPKIVQYFFKDSENITLAARFGRSDFPRYERSRRNELLYHWLNQMGYRTSTEEAEWLTGEHEIFHRGEEVKDEE